MARRTDPAVRRIQRAVAAVVPAGPIGVACSGGPDSVALADAAVEVCGGGRVVLVHVDHQLHAGSGAVATQVRALAEALGAACEVVRVTVAKGASLEDQARAARYAALDRVIASRGLAAMLEGHTARDQAETVLLRIVRGTGPAGLAGIPPVRGRHVRPLLEVARADTVAYCAARGLPTVADPMNDDRRFARVRARTDLVPRLVAENPRIEDALVRLARAAAEWTDVIDAPARALAAPRMSVAALVAAGPAIGKRALQLVVPALEGDHLDRAWALTRAQSGRRVEVPGATIERAFDDVVVVTAGIGESPSLIVEGPDAPYEVRRWRAGDRMRPARLRGRSRKLSDLLADARVARRERAIARVVVRASDGTIVWAEHVGAAANVIIQVRPDRSERAPFQ